MKFTSRDSTSRLRPAPPSIESLPPFPVKVSSPPSPLRRLALSSPMSVSLKAEPVMLRNPATTSNSLADPPARSTRTPAFAAEKSSELTPVPPCTFSIFVKAKRLATEPSVPSVNVPSSSFVTVTSAVTAVKSIVSTPCS